MACDEKPEDVRVIGAATGSVILIMAGTLAFTTLLAKVSKNIASVAKDIIGIRVEIENLRQTGILNRALESELKRIEKEKADTALTTIEGLISEHLKNKDGDIKNALTNSIKKLLNFSEKGGTVDFVAPEDDETEGGAPTEDGGFRAALTEVKAAIREYQGERESLKLLTDGTKEA